MADLKKVRDLIGRRFGFFVASGHRPVSGDGHDVAGATLRSRPDRSLRVVMLVSRVRKTSSSARVHRAARNERRQELDLVRSQVKVVLRELFIAVRDEDEVLPEKIRQGKHLHFPKF